MKHKENCAFCKNKTNKNSLVLKIIDIQEHIKDAVCMNYWTEYCNDNNNELYHKYKNALDVAIKALEKAREGLNIPASLINARPIDPFIPDSAAEKLDSCALEVIRECYKHYTELEEAIEQIKEILK